MNRDKYTAERVLHQHVEHFLREWAPSDPRRRAHFSADLIALVQAVHRDAMIPVEHLLSTALSCIPPLQVFPKDKL